MYLKMVFYLQKNFGGTFQKSLQTLIYPKKILKLQKSQKGALPEIPISEKSSNCNPPHVSILSTRKTQYFYTFIERSSLFIRTLKGLPFKGDLKKSVCLRTWETLIFRKTSMIFFLQNSKEIPLSLKAYKTPFLQIDFTRNFFVQKFLEGLLSKVLRKTVCLLKIPLESHQSLEDLKRDFLYESTKRVPSAKESWKVIPGGSSDFKRLEEGVLSLEISRG